MTILDIGAGMGYFTIPLAKLTGETGRVIAADLQLKMLEGIRRRAVKAGVIDRIALHQCLPEKIGVQKPVDFCLAFWMIHEVPDRPRFIKEVADCLKPGGLWLIAEPKLHVSRASFDATVETARGHGLSVKSVPDIFFSNTAVLTKQI
jgi:ubiquinone/menaquinone biosynthesis C-methylase UbiE